VSHCDKIGVTNHKGAFFMTTGEKIKYFRNMRGISQETLGQLSGINSATIKKYEYGIRNPKPDQLLKIANALGISINIFMDFDIETVSDVLSLLFKLDDQIDMKFEADKDKDGNFKPATLRMSFKNPMINKKICTYMKALELRENMINSKDDYSEEEFNASLQRINENIEEIKQHLLDDSMVVKKGTDRLTVKVYQN
jgi:transcriptional regulator with XRE-family HTH domain